MRREKIEEERSRSRIQELIEVMRPVGLELPDDLKLSQLLTDRDDLTTDTWFAQKKRLQKDHVITIYLSTAIGGALRGGIETIRTIRNESPDELMARGQPVTFRHLRLVDIRVLKNIFGDHSGSTQLSVDKEQHSLPPKIPFRPDSMS